MTRVDAVQFAKALADETRQKIMGLCCCDWLSVNEIVEKTSVTQPTVSHHLAVLREAGLGQCSRGRQTDILYIEPGQGCCLLRPINDQVRTRDGNDRSHKADRA